MSDRIKESWSVFKSIEIGSGDFCVDFFTREDGSFGFEEFRRDIEDMGRWTGINYYSVMQFENEKEAITEARSQVRWLDELLERTDV